MLYWAQRDSVLCLQTCLEVFITLSSAEVVTHFPTITGSFGYSVVSHLNIILFISKGCEVLSVPNHCNRLLIIVFYFQTGKRNCCHGMTFSCHGVHSMTCTRGWSIPKLSTLDSSGFPSMKFFLPLSWPSEKRQKTVCTCFYAQLSYVQSLILYRDQDKVGETRDTLDAHISV